MGPFFQAWWEHAAHEFRLTSYLFGERYLEEEVASRFTWKRLPLIRDLGWVRALEDAPAGSLAVKEQVHDDGGFARVPASDTVIFPEDPKMKGQMLVPTTEAGSPFDQRGIDLIEAQNEAARKHHRNILDDYQIIYLPPNFMLRAILFIVYIWITGATMGITLFGTPILIGRQVLDHFDSLPAHDGYSFLVGATLTWAMGVVGIVTYRAMEDIQAQREVNRVKASLMGASQWTRWRDAFELYVGRISQALIWSLKHLALWTMIGFVIPLLMAIVLELYLIMPIRTSVNQSEADIPMIHVWEDWALGCILATICLRMGRMRPPNNRLIQAWDNVCSRDCPHSPPSVLTAHCFL
jgi:E3 ubiquitin-protein ligase MARCH6